MAASAWLARRAVVQGVLPAARHAVVPADYPVPATRRVALRNFVALAPVAPPVMADVETPVVTQEASSMWLQLGAFSSPENAEAFRVRALASLQWNREPIDVSARDGLYRVRLGPYRNRQEATAIAEKVRESLGFAPSFSNR